MGGEALDMRGRLILIGVLFLVVGLGAALWYVRFAGWHIPDDPDELILFSVDGPHPVYGGQDDGSRVLLYNYPVLGSVPITDPELCREVVAAVKADIETASERQNKCFDPRHVLRVTKGGRTFDVLICFQCHNYQLWRDGVPQQLQTRSAGKLSQPLLNKVLTDAGVPIAPVE
jgi:hypothetical protein